MNAERWRQIDKICIDALDRTPAERASFLDAACANDPSLRQEVEALLGSVEQADRFLESPALDALDGARESEPGGFANKTFGPYRTTTLLGFGGMGEVYLAEDTRLHRKVALKLLAPRLLKDPRSRARFLREARSVSRLNHPHICVLHDIGQQDGIDYLVMEYLEGETLAARLQRGSLPSEQALRYALEIADALDKAHRQGVTHRDLKPGNIMLTKSGAKLLDFGLAKLSRPTTGEAGEGTSADASSVSARGSIVGTLHYMAPEQLEGKEADARTDIFAFGAVLYEMWTGRKAFEGPSQSSVIAAIMRVDPPPVSSLQPMTPRAIDRVVRTCLTKDPDDRWQTAHDLKLQLQAIAEESAQPAVAGPLPSRREKGKWLGKALWIVATVLVLAVLAVLWGGPTPGSALRLTPLSSELLGSFSPPVWSPDGKAVAYAAREKETDSNQVYVRYLDSPVSTPLTHIPEGAFPGCWTSAGRIIFVRPERVGLGLWSISPVGGEPEPFFAARPLRGGDVSPDGSVVATLEKKGDNFSLWISSATGAPGKEYQPAPFAVPTLFRQPDIRFSPDGKQILLLQNPGTGEQAWLIPYPADPSRPPRRVFFRDLPAPQTTPQFSWMPDSRHIVMSTGDTQGMPPQLYMADTVSGKVESISSSTAGQRHPAVSPDGARLIYMEQSVNYDIVSVDLSTAEVTPLIATQRNESMPGWASRKLMLAYVTNRNGVPEIWLHMPGQADRPLVGPQHFPPQPNVVDGFLRRELQWFESPVLSPETDRVFYTECCPAWLWMSAVRGGAPVRLTKGDAAREYVGSPSSDGMWLVYLELSVSENRGILKKVKTSGQAEPVVLKPSVDWGPVPPIWSPGADWILHYDNGFKLLSSDGTSEHEAPSPHALVYAFSHDGKTLYGIRESGGRLEVFSVGVAGGPERIIGPLAPEYRPVSPINPGGLRLSVSPDDKSIAFSTVKETSSLWLMEGLPPPKHGLLERLGLR